MNKTKQKPSHTETTGLITEWDLTKLYTGDTDPKIELELQNIESTVVKFEKKYKGKDFTSNPKKLAIALAEYEHLSNLFSEHNSIVYFQLRNAINSNDDVATAQSSLISDRLVAASNRVQFFDLTIAKIPTKDQKVFLKDPILKPYKYALEKTFESARYNLSEAEENMVSLLSGPAVSRWIDGQDKLVSQQMIEFGGKQIPLAEAKGIMQNQPKKLRRELYVKINERLREIAQFAESEINAIYTFKKIMDEKRGYKNPYTATVLGYENDEKTVESMVSIVTENFSISRDFYKLHAELLGEKKQLSFADRAVPIGKIAKQFDFKAGCDVVRSAFSKFGLEYAEYLDTYLNNGQIDVFAKKGKTDGAFCCPTGGQRNTYVLLNYVNDINSVSTLAHEMGHAIHTEKSKAQPPLYQGYTISVAEVASTFFELVLFDELVATLTAKEQKILYHDKLMGDMSTIFRQIACFGFELDLHQQIRSVGYITHNQIAKTLTKHLQSYAGDAFALDETDGYFFVFWSHIRNHFYVYSYAMGQMISRALYENWKRDPAYKTKIESFLSAGGSMSPRDIFKATGIDISDPEFYKTALMAIKKDIQTLRKMK